MLKPIFLSFLFLLAITFSHCSDDVTLPNERNIRPLTSIEKSLIDADNQFGISLFKEISAYQANKNVFISPVSVSMALGMTLNGANGPTKEAIQNSLELENLTTEQVNESYKSLIKSSKNS